MRACACVRLGNKSCMVCRLADDDVNNIMYRVFHEDITRCDISRDHMKDNH